MDKIERALRAAVQGCNPHCCAEAADLLGIEHPDCFECGGDECDECAERVADAMAAHLMPDGVQWPRFEDGEPVRLGDMAQGRDCAHEVRSVRIDGDGWSLYNDDGLIIDDGYRCERATRPAAVGPTDAVRCADCKHARVTPRGLSCAVHGSARWFATEADGFCHRGESR